VFAAPGEVKVGAGDCSDTGPEVNGKSADVVAAELDLSRVHSGADLDAEGCDSVADRARALHRAGWAVECGEHPSPVGLLARRASELGRGTAPESDLDAYWAEVTDAALVLGDSQSAARRRVCVPLSGHQLDVDVALKLIQLLDARPTSAWAGPLSASRTRRSVLVGSC
jgi:hypothetical protein